MKYKFNEVAEKQVPCHLQENIAQNTVKIDKLKLTRPYLVLISTLQKTSFELFNFCKISTIRKVNEFSLYIPTLLIEIL